MKRKILCPICHGRLFDADDAVAVNVSPVSQNAEIQGAIYVKCSKCASICAVTLEPSEIKPGIPPAPSDPIMIIIYAPQQGKLNMVHSVQSLRD